MPIRIKNGDILNQNHYEMIMSANYKHDMSKHNEQQCWNPTSEFMQYVLTVFRCIVMAKCGH